MSIYRLEIIISNLVYRFFCPLQANQFAISQAISPFFGCNEQKKQILQKPVSLLPRGIDIRKMTSVMLIALSLCMVGCDASKDELDAYIQQIKVRKSHTLPPLPQFKTRSNFVYQQDNKRRNPFKAMSMFSEGESRMKHKQALEVIALNSLEFVGTLKRGDLVWALVRQPNGYVTHVGVGDYIGQHHGLIVRILDKSICIQENITSAGSDKKKTIKLLMKRHSQLSLANR